jgi:hypothetical protein
MSGPDESGPSVAAPEPPDHKKSKSSGGNLAAQPSAVNARQSDNDEPLTREELAAARADLNAMLGRDDASASSSEPAPMADFLRTRELPPRLRGTVISHPLPQGDGAPSSHIDRVVFWETTPDREERRRTYTILRLLHRRGLLPLGALIIARLEGGLAIAVDAPDPERFAAYQKKLNGMQWAFAPWNVRACTFTETQYRLAEDLKLGIVYHDELPGEQLP